MGGTYRAWPYNEMQAQPESVTDIKIWTPYTFHVSRIIIAQDAGVVQLVKRLPLAQVMIPGSQGPGMEHWLIGPGMEPHSRESASPFPSGPPFLAHALSLSNK